MTVPKKRKKLAETSENLKKSIPGRHMKKEAGKAEIISIKNSTKKIDNAFKIMRHIEEDDLPEDKASERKGSIREKKPDSPSFQPKRQGFRFRISLDALIPDNDDMFSFSHQRGTVNGDMVQIESADNGYTMRVVVSAVGRIRLCSSSDHYIGGYAAC